jgi:hypothetical protein
MEDLQGLESILAPPEVRKVAQAMPIDFRPKSPIGV